MSYAPQVPWLRQATIKENIICSEPWDESRFRSIVRACALEPDFQQMPLGCDTPVAEKGISLSGGQKQRVALARATYRKADIYVLDNPISGKPARVTNLCPALLSHAQPCCLIPSPALDDNTQEFIWKNLIEGFLHDATIVVASSRPVISCTGVLHLTPDGLRESALQMVSGFVPGIHVDDMPLPRYATAGAEVTNVFSRLTTSCIPAAASGGNVPSRRSRFNSVGTTIEEAAVSDVSAAVLEYEEWSALENDSARQGRNTKSSLHHELISSDFKIERTSFIQHLLEHTHSMRNDTVARHVRTTYGSKYPENRRFDTIDGNDNSSKERKRTPDGDSENFISKSDLGIVQWIAAMKLGKAVFFIPLSYIMYQAGRTYYFGFLQWWAEAEFGFSGQTFVIIVSCVFTVMTIARFACDILVYRAAINAAQRMRKNFCDSILNAPMSFFMTENLGPLVDVFSGDMSAVSEVLIDCFHYAVMYTFLVLGSMMWSSSRFPYLFLISAVLLAGCAWLQVGYRARLKKVSLEFQKANNDVFHSVSDAIEGIKILRTADATTWALDDITHVLKIARIAVVTSEKCTIWLNTRSCGLGLIVCAAMVFVAHYAVSDSTSRRIITNQTSLYIIFLQWAMKTVGLGIYHLGSVERIHSYLHRIPRESRDGRSLDKSWPKQGDLEFKNVCLKYAPEMPLALDGVSFKLPPASKVGVVGRTGSGKSTLLVSLFRLINPCSGDMVVGGNSIVDVHLDYLREQMSIIPQVVVVFTNIMHPGENM
jgi:ABC-type multidrug transport system fused ATPase/permease subunit